MSWYNGNYLRRESVAIDGSGSSGGSHDVEIAIPADWDAFWDHIRADGLDIALVNADNTLAVFQFKAGFNIPNRNLTLQVDNYALAQTGVTGKIFIYWDYAANTTDIRGTFTLGGSPINGYISQCLPAGRIVRNIGITPTGTQPQTIFSKEPSEKVDVFFPVNAVLATRAQPYNQKLQCNEVSYVLLDVQNSSGVSQAPMKADEEIRFIGGWCRVRIQAGSTGTDYVIKILVHTTDAQDIFLNAILEVNALLPT